MRSLSMSQMAQVYAGKAQPSALACIGGAVLGLAGIVLAGLGTAAVGVVAASLGISFLSPVLG